MLTVTHKGSMIFHSIEVKLVTARLCGSLERFVLSMRKGFGPSRQHTDPAAWSILRAVTIRDLGSTATMAGASRYP